MPYAKNARVHTTADVNAIARSIAKFGFTIPILAGEDGVILAGHARVLAAKKLGLADVPVLIAEGWSETEKRAYSIADNQLAARATWDDTLLQQELADLHSLNFNLLLTGFDASAISTLLSARENALCGDPEWVPDPSDTAVSRLGDVWRLGAHRVACGDATNSAHVALALNGATPSLMVTDPPYGISYDAAWRNKALGPADRATGKVLNDNRADWREAWALFPGDVIYVWHAGLLGSVVAESLEASGFEVKSQIVQAKDHFAIGRSNYQWQHELCLYAVRKGRPSQWAPDRKQGTVWNFASNNAANSTREKTWGHSTQKPVEAMRRPIEHTGKAGDYVYDPFLGTGTTLIAAELTGRVCIGLELNPLTWT